MKLTITEKDQAGAKDYSDYGYCLVATMLKRRRHKNVAALAWTVYADGKTFTLADWTAVIEFYDNNRLKVKKSAIGKKIELVEVA